MRASVRAIAAVALTFSLWPASAAEARPRFGAVVAPVKLVPYGGETPTIAGLHSYTGTIKIGSAGDGLVLVNQLPLEQYLLGLDEVPTTWPMEALRAQAVAARTYALHTLAQPRAGAAATYGFDICASVECQVFSGADAIDSITGQRWIEAVVSTASETILFEGTPILARYSSTTGGATLANSQAFPTEGDLPYLQPVTSTTEEASPVYRWVVRFQLRQLQAMLESSGWWDARLGRLRNVSTVPSSAGFHYPDVRLEGKTTTVRLSAEELRDTLRELAPSMHPSQYPSFAPTSSGRLPETFPSNRYIAATRGGTVTITGRGWGHAVGMSQWGAHGLARLGASYRDILEHYYTGVTIEPYADPGAIEVGVGWARSSVAVSGAFSIVDGRGGIVVERALGTWRFAWAGAGVVAIDPPEGFGLPLTVGVVHAPRRVDAGEQARITIALSRPAQVRTQTRPRDGRTQEPVILEAGRHHIYWTAPTEKGSYEVSVRAGDGRASKVSPPVVIRVLAAAAEPEPQAPSEDKPGGGPPILLILAAVALAGTIFWGIAAVTIER